MTVAFGVPVNVTVALPPEQTVALALMPAVGNGATVMVIVPVAGAEQPGVPEVATLTSVYVVSVVNVPVIVAVPAASRTIVWLPGVPVTVYVTVAFGVPVKVTVAVPPEQTVALEAMLAVGGVTTVMVMLPAAGCVHAGVPEVITLTSVKVVVAV